MIRSAPTVTRLSTLVGGGVRSRPGHAIAWGWGPRLENASGTMHTFKSCHIAPNHRHIISVYARIAPNHRHIIIVYAREATEVVIGENAGLGIRGGD